MISSRGFAPFSRNRSSIPTELLFVGIFRFGNAVSKRGQQVPRLQVYIDLLEGSLSAVGAVNDGQ
jgi:hypothetical protein